MIPKLRFHFVFVSDKDFHHEETNPLPTKAKGRKKTKKESKSLQVELRAKLGESEVIKNELKEQADELKAAQEEIMAENIRKRRLWLRTYTRLSRPNWRMKLWRNYPLKKR